MQRLARSALLITLLFSSLALAVSPTLAVSEEVKKGVLGGLKEAASGTFETSEDDTTSLGAIVVTGLQVTIGLLGVIAVILIIYSGMLWMTAGGKEEQITKAKKIIIQSIIGIIIIALTYAIITFVLSFFVSA